MRSQRHRAETMSTDLDEAAFEAALAAWQPLRALPPSAHLSAVPGIAQSEAPSWKLHSRQRAGAKEIDMTAHLDGDP
jgi:hypothetical protein